MGSDHHSFLVTGSGLDVHMGVDLDSQHRKHHDACQKQKQIWTGTLDFFHKGVFDPDMVHDVGVQIIVFFHRSCPKFKGNLLKLIQREGSPLNPLNTRLLMRIQRILIALPERIKTHKQNNSVNLS